MDRGWIVVTVMGIKADQNETEGNKKGVPASDMKNAYCGVKLVFIVPSESIYLRINSDQ